MYVPLAISGTILQQEPHNPAERQKTAKKENWKEEEDLHYNLAVNKKIILKEITWSPVCLSSHCGTSKFLCLAQDQLHCHPCFALEVYLSDSYLQPGQKGQSE